MNLFAEMPPNFPVFGGLPIWLVLICIAAAFLLIGFVNKLYFAWLHRNWSGLFRARSVLAIFVLCAAFIAVAMWVNPPSEVARQFHQNRPQAK